MINDTHADALYAHFQEKYSEQNHIQCPEALAEVRDSVSRELTECEGCAGMERHCERLRAERVYLNLLIAQLAYEVREARRLLLGNNTTGVVH